MLNPGMFSITLQPEENVEGELIFMPTEVLFYYFLNPLLHRLILDHYIIIYFKTTLIKFKKNLSSVLNTFENIKENGAFAPKKQMLHFP